MNNLNNVKNQDSEEYSQQLIEREKRWNENYIKQKRNAYRKKFGLENINIYQKLFEFMNNKIRYQIELSEKKENFSSKSRTGKNLFSISKYPLIYQRNVKAILQILKEQKFSQKNWEHMQLPLIRSIKKIDIVRESLKKEKKSLFQQIKPKLLNYDPHMKFLMEIKKKQKRLQKKGEKLRRMVREREKLKTKDNIDPSMFNLYNSKPKSVQKSFSRNSYLVSLNYDFSNPIIN